MGYYEKLVEYYKNTPQEEIDRTWEKSADYDNFGIKVSEMLNNIAMEEFLKLMGMFIEEQSEESTEFFNLDTNEWETDDVEGWVNTVGFDDTLRYCISFGGTAKRKCVRNETVITAYKDKLYHMDVNTGVRYPYVPTNEDLFANDWILI